MLTISDSMRLITADTTRVMETIKSHVLILNVLGRVRLVIRLTSTNGTKFLPYR